MEFYDFLYHSNGSAMRGSVGAKLKQGPRQERLSLRFHARPEKPSHIRCLSLIFLNLHVRAFSKFIFISINSEWKLQRYGLGFKFVLYTSS